MVGQQKNGIRLAQSTKVFCSSFQFGRRHRSLKQNLRADTKACSLEFSVSRRGGENRGPPPTEALFSSNIGSTSNLDVLSFYIEGLNENKFVCETFSNFVCGKQSNASIHR